jgi:hypothetical protein
MTLKVFDITGPFAVATEDGQKIYEAILPYLKKEERVFVDFTGITTIIGAFASAAFGQLHEIFPEQSLNKLLVFSNFNEEGLECIYRGMENSKRYYQRKEAYDRAWTEEMGE